MFLLNSNAKAQKGVIANYKANEMYLCFVDIESGDMYKQPVIMGRNVRVQHNVSLERFVITYTDALSGTTKEIHLRFVRYEKDGRKGMIMQDGHNNPLTVYNDLQSDGTLSLVSHELVGNGKVSMILIQDTKEMY